MLAAMERVCDHMLEAWFVPVIKPEPGKTEKSVALFTKILNITEAKFNDAFPGSADPEGGIPENYYETVKNILTTVEQRAAQLQFYKCKTEVVLFTSWYNEETNTYIIKDLILRPCLWETGVIRQITNAAVQGLKSRPSTDNATQTNADDGSPMRVQLQFQLTFGPSFLVSLTMDDLPTIFQNDTPYLLKDVKGAVQKYTLPFLKLPSWTESYEKSVLPELKDGWIRDKLKEEDNSARFISMRAKFGKYSDAKQKGIIAAMEGWEFLRKTLKYTGKTKPT